MARGLMVYPMGGTLDGRLGDHVLLAPPFIVSEDDLDTIVERLAQAIDAAIAAIARNQGLDFASWPCDMGGLSALTLCASPANGATIAAFS
jgi:hypothetical protein